MSERAIHCPFLNRSDTRCSSHFSLDRLNDAFEQCLDAYQACPVYLEMLAERRQRRGEAMLDFQLLRPGQRVREAGHADGKPSSQPFLFVPLTLAGRKRDTQHYR